LNLSNKNKLYLELSYQLKNILFSSSESNLKKQFKKPNIKFVVFKANNFTLKIMQMSGKLNNADFLLFSKAHNYI
jgi:hypothetical protein